MSVRRIGEVTGEFLRGLDARGRAVADAVEIARQWDDIVGKDLARHLTVLGLDDGTLDVGASSSTWLSEARFFESMLREKVRQCTGLVIGRVKFHLAGGRASEAGGRGVGAEASRWKDGALETAEEAEIENALQSCSNGRVATRLRQLFRLSLLRGRWRSERGG